MDAKLQQFLYKTRKNPSFHLEESSRMGVIPETYLATVACLTMRKWTEEKKDEKSI